MLIYLPRETPLKRVRLHRKLWYVEINVKIEIRRYWWITGKISRANIFVDDNIFALRIRCGWCWLSSSRSGLPLSGKKLAGFSRPPETVNKVLFMQGEPGPDNNHQILGHPHQAQVCQVFLLCISLEVIQTFNFNFDSLEGRHIEQRTIAERPCLPSPRVR